MRADSPHDDAASESATILDSWRVLQARKRVVLITILIVPAVALLFSVRERPLYRASATVLLQDQNLAGSLAGVTDLSSAQPDRFAQTQADLARSPAVIDRTLAAVGARDRTAAHLLSDSSVSARSNADVLDFQVTDPTPAQAVRLANAYARQFVAYERDFNRGDISSTLADVQQQINALSLQGDRQGVQYLSRSLQQLRAIEALQSSHAALVGPATGASKVQPRPLRTATLGLAVAIVLGISLAFLWEAVDTRVRSAEEIGEQLGLPLLGRIPVPDDSRSATQPFLAEPDPARLDAVRTLRLSLDLVNLESPCRTIVITSAVEGSEKSVTAANLALSFAAAGRRVALVDLDLRTRHLGSRFAANVRPGLVEVALKQATLDEALQPVLAYGSGGNHSPRAAARQSRRSNGNGRRPGDGIVELLAAAEAVPDPGGILASRRIGEILTKLSERADVVLIEAPPLLVTGHAFTVGTSVDGVLLVARLNTLRRPMLEEIRRVLEHCPATKLGFVLAEPDHREHTPAVYVDRLKARSDRWSDELIAHVPTSGNS